MRGTVTHTIAECGSLDGREAVAMKAYYIVVLDIVRFLPLSSSSIPSNQPIGYYRLLLEGRNVEPGLGAIEYRRLLRGGNIEDPPPIEGGDEVSIWCETFMKSISKLSSRFTVHDVRHARH